MNTRTICVCAFALSWYALLSNVLGNFEYIQCVLHLIQLSVGSSVRYFLSALLFETVIYFCFQTTVNVDFFLMQKVKLGDMKGIRPVKTECWYMTGALHVFRLSLLPPTSSIATAEF